MPNVKDIGFNMKLIGAAGALVVAAPVYLDRPVQAQAALFRTSSSALFLVPLNFNTCTHALWLTFSRWHSAWIQLSAISDVAFFM